jgi:hypothetical protein
MTLPVTPLMLAAEGGKFNDAKHFRVQQNLDFGLLCNNWILVQISFSMPLF